MKKKILAVVIILAVVSGMGWAETEEEQAVKKVLATLLLNIKWEYKCLTLESLLNVSSPSDLLGSDNGLNAKTEKALRKLGKQRWELVHINDRGYTFKRPVEI